MCFLLRTDRECTSLTALFTSGPYVDKEAVVYTIADASVDKYVIPMPWYYPENSDNETSEYMKCDEDSGKVGTKLYY